MADLELWEGEEGDYVLQATLQDGQILRWSLDETILTAVQHSDMVGGDQRLANKLREIATRLDGRRT